jgi:hypothetical protein
MLGCGGEHQKSSISTDSGFRDTQVFALGMRRTRYRGLLKTHLQHIATATAINLQRFMDWLWEVPRSRTYKSPFARLAPAI